MEADHALESKDLQRDSPGSITQYLDATTHTPDDADLIFIPGTRLLDPAQIAATLMSDGIASLVVVTGGINKVTRINEATTLHNELIAHGVPPNQILVESRSTNTLENVQYAWPLIADRIGSRPLKSVLAVCKWMHSRRVLMTLKANFPSGIAYYAHTYIPDGVTRETWSQTNEIPQTGNVLSNWHNIPQYLNQGDITEITRADDGSWR